MIRLGTCATLLVGVTLLLCLSMRHSALAVTIKRVPGLNGLHWDIEPHTLSQWDSDYTAVATDFLNLLTDLKSIQQSNELSLSVDGTWYSINPRQPEPNFALFVAHSVANCHLDSSQCPPSCSLTYNGKTKPVSEHVRCFINFSIAGKSFPAFFAARPAHFMC